jgi:hypothetical protein
MLVFHTVPTWELPGQLVVEHLLTYE